MEVKLITATPKAEEIILYTARVSNPANQDSTNTKLLDYCIKHAHWSIFEQADMTVEIQTSRAIAAQILRHRSFVFQEFSQRYAEVGDDSFELYPARRQDPKNRQNSVDDMSEEDREWFIKAQQAVIDASKHYYQESLKRGIAKEQARFLLPLNTKTKLYMKGNLRSWITYLDLRCGQGTQLEHIQIAEAIKTIFVEQFPIIAKAKGWG